MIRIIGQIPKNITVACSGGIDSMVFVHFLLQGRRNVNLAYFNHDTQHSHKAQKFVENYAKQSNLDLFIGRVKGRKGKRSLEEFWRDERYDFLQRIGGNYTITCHHLDDCVETWLMSSFHGQTKLIPFKRSENIFRPFLMTSKKIIKQYAERKSVDWIEDPSNQHTNFMRNHVRYNIIPQVLIVNPGIRSTIRKKLIETYL
ncbi:MAG: tRNA lysidine(34) synthetase TilS [Flavobacteriaceae bacterium]|nr:tRNA lysidine(34) synthetase TilS [Flavobacteriaceae bacterium]|tara:strand:+ start:1219 stop:1821 length:603 start_codon:yes stop_codon:yes gene_type:complete